MGANWKSIRSLFAVGALAVFAPLTQANLLVNGRLDVTVDDQSQSLSAPPWTINPASALLLGDDHSSPTTSANGGHVVLIIGTVLSQSLDLAAGGDYSLSFWLKPSSSAFDVADVLVGGGWVLDLDSVFIRSPSDNEGWSEFAVDLMFNGPTVNNVGTLSFGYGGEGQLFVDDFELICPDENCVIPRDGPSVPEPGTLVLMGAALAGLAVIRRRRNR